MNVAARTEQTRSAFEEKHFPIRYWADLWGFSEKTVREWFRDEYVPGILRQPNVGRRARRDYTTIMVSPSAASLIYARRIGAARDQRSAREVM